MASAGPPGAPSPRSLPPPAPPQNAPPNLRRSANHRCLGVPAEPRTSPNITSAPQSEERGATTARSEFWGAAPREDSGWGRRGAHGAAGGAPDHLSLFPSLPPQRIPSTLTAAAGRGRAGAWPAAETEAAAAAEGKPPSPSCCRDAVVPPVGDPSCGGQAQAARVGRANSPRPGGWTEEEPGLRRAERRAGGRAPSCRGGANRL